ncbi:MAG: hypothetical protein JWO10_1444, partial [Microbacteriaceae bacterium]|nr:hypothetical protein [Microbacteriaceae bacterium]
LQGSVITLVLNQQLDIKTGSLEVESYTGTVSDPSVAKFVKGRKDGGAEFNPGVKPLKVGETQVTLKNAQGGIQNVVFTLKVTK